VRRARAEQYRVIKPVLLGEDRLFRTGRRRSTGE
jgi:hypothetical protein